MANTEARKKALQQLSATSIAQQREADEAPPLPVMADDVTSNWTPPPRSYGPGYMPANPASEVALMRAQTGGARAMPPDDSYLGGNAPGSAHARQFADNEALEKQMAYAGRLDGEQAVRDLDQSDWMRRDMTAAGKEDGARAVAMLDAGKGRAFKGVSAEDMAALEAQQAKFQQGLLAQGQASPRAPAAPAAQARRPVVSVSTVGPAGPVPQARPLSAPAPRPEGASTAAATVGRDTSSKGPGDGEFAAAQAAASDRRRSVGLGRAAAEFTRNLSGVGFDEGAYNQMEQDADNPVRQLVAQREADRQKSMTDPTSDASRRVQAAVAKSMPGVYKPEELAQITAGDADMVTKYGAMRQRLDERKADMAREDALRAAKETREDTLRADERRFQSQQAGAGRAFQASQADRAFQHQKELATLNNAADLQQAQARAKLGPDGRPIGQSGIPGLEVQPGAAPTEDDAKKMKDSMASADRVNTYVDELQALHDKYGTELGGAAGARMAQLRKAILLEAKNIGQLGALSSDDMKIVDDIMGSDPSSLSGNAKAMLGIDNTQSSLQGLKKWVSTAVDSNMKTRGYQRRSGGQAAPSNPATAGGERKQYSPSRNMTRVVDAQGNVIRTEQGDTRGG